jgi:MerR family transcriptional regulator/heat shock protein HspR
MRRTDPHYWSELPGTRPDTERIAPLASSPSDIRGTRDDEPCFVISIAARMVGMHAQTLRYYERAGLVSPARTKGNIRLYRKSDIDRLRLIQRLIADHGVNLAGVEMMLRMEQTLRSLRDRVAALEREISRVDESVDEP